MRPGPWRQRRGSRGLRQRSGEAGGTLSGGTAESVRGRRRALLLVRHAAIQRLGSIASTSEPTITGTPAVGRTLTAQHGTWLPTSGLSFGYRWYAGAERIAGADARRLLLTPALAGARIRVHVIATARGWASAVGRSGSVGPVAP